MSNILFANEEIQGELDEQQLAAVQAPIGNICVNAVAGSGKTRVLTYRVSNLIENGVSEDEIMLLTFTNKAAKEMVARVKEVLNREKVTLTYGTFHSVACSFLREYASLFGMSSSFGVISPGEQAAFMQNLRDEHINIYFNGEQSSLPNGYILSEVYSGAINKDIPFYKYMEESYSRQISEVARENVIDFFEKYEQYKEEHNKVDYDDMLLKVIDLFTFFPKVKKELAMRYKHILVDEYQDINWMQHTILKELNEHNGLFAIGDKAQCIYQFRGSRPEYIENFGKDYTDAQILSLNYNYRSSKAILNFAQCSINHNDFGVTLRSTFENNEPVRVMECSNEEAELEQIINDIQTKHIKELGKVAILVRTGKQQNYVLNALKTHKISTFVQKENLKELPYIKSLLAFMYLCEAPEEPVNYKEALIAFKGIGEKTSEDIVLQLRNNKCNIERVKSKYELVNAACVSLSKIALPAKNYIKQNGNPMPLPTMIKLILDSFYGATLSENKVKFIYFIRKCAITYKNVSEFDDGIRNGDVSVNVKNPSVTVMTMHSSKGLEWEYVYLPFVTNNTFPSVPYWEVKNNSDNVKNERNLFYVAATRAKESLTMTYSTESKSPKYPAGASLFITEMVKSYYKLIKKG